MHIVNKYTNRIDVIYKKFDENLGSKDLVAQWERCIDLTKDEEWLWMFSDDDIMDMHCVEEFYAVLGKQNSDVYHFNINIIDSCGSLIRKCAEYPSYISVLEFFSFLFASKIDARMPEFIFNKKRFLENGRFPKFELALRTDTAAVMINAFQHGIRTIPNSLISWRLSSENVSAPKCGMLMLRKTRATILFFCWTKDLFKNNNKLYPLSLMVRLKILFLEFVYPLYLKLKGA